MVKTRPSTEVRALTRQDLAGFDKVATNLVLEMQQEGWAGYVSARQHAVMRHPDGSTQSISRASSRASSGTAMRARFEAWKRRRAEREAAASSAFGEFGEEPPSLPVPVPTMLEIKRHDTVGAFIADQDSTVGDDWAIIGYDENPRAWSVFDLNQPYPVLIGYGSQTSETDAWAALMEVRPDLFPSSEPDPQGVGESDQEDVVASVYVCTEEGCGKQFDTQRKASVHTASAHRREQVECPEKGCSWTGDKHVLKRHHDAVHDTKVHPCPFCGQEFGTSAGLSQHRTRKHAGQEPPTVTITHLETTVAPQGSDDEPAPAPAGGDHSGASVVERSHNVLMKHFESLPEGADAEDAIAAIRSIVAGPLVAQVRALTEELDRVIKERDKFAAEAADFEARLTLMREVMGV